MNRFAWSLIGLVILTNLALADSTREYVVRPGDSCLGIANRELGDAKRLDDLHRVNPNLGQPPHKLVPGQRLRLPESKVTAVAKLAGKRGPVDVNAAGSNDWSGGVKGQDLFKSWRVATRTDAAAKIQFTDASIEMRPDTVVVIFGSVGVSSVAARTQLQRGVLRSRLAALDGKPQVSIETPAGKTELTDGSAIVDVDAKGETKLANHGGSAAKLSGKAGASVTVKQGFGSKVEVGKAPEPPTPLPPAPEWSRPNDLLLGWSGQPISIRGEWSAVAGAQAYRIEISRSGADVIEARLEVSGAIHRMEVSNLPAGDYEITIATVNAKGLEGVPSTPRRVRVVEVEPPAPVVGALVTPPSGLACAWSNGSQVLVRDDDGRARLTCTAGTASATLELEVPRPEFKRMESSQAPRVRTGESFTLDLEVRGVRPSAFRAIGRGGIEVVSIDHATSPTIRIHLRAGAPAPDAAVLISALEFSIATIEVAVESSPSLSVPAGPRVKQHETARPRVTVAGLVGTTALAGGVVTPIEDAMWLGGDLTVHLTRWISPHASVVRREGSHQTYLVGATLGFEGVLRPLLRLGASVDDGRLGGHAGLGVDVEVTRSLSLRLQGDAIVHPDETRIGVGVGIGVRY